MEEQIILKVENLSVKFDEERVLDNVSFEIKKGTIFAVVGPNGAGKTTLFRALFNFIPYQGKIEWQSGVKKGYVPQRLSVDSYFPITVKEFLALKLKKEDKEQIFEVLKNVGFSGDEHHLEKHLLDKKLGSLSGGEFQKLLIAFALLDKPDVLLFDEPTSGVDIGSEETIYHTLAD
ncbi:MAG: metal ABC transporter ATP-binding protein, partial [Patescibacteria group bacterium]